MISISRLGSFCDIKKSVILSTDKVKNPALNLFLKIMGMTSSNAKKLIPNQVHPNSDDVRSLLFCSSPHSRILVGFRRERFPFPKSKYCFSCRYKSNILHQHDDSPHFVPSCCNESSSFCATSRDIESMHDDLASSHVDFQRMSCLIHLKLSIIRDDSRVPLFDLFYLSGMKNAQKFYVSSDCHSMTLLTEIDRL